MKIKIKSLTLIVGLPILLFILSPTFLGSSLNAQESVREKLYKGLVCHRFLGVSGPDTFVCDVVKPYPVTQLHPLIREAIGIRIRGIRVADRFSKSRKERKFAIRTEEFLKTVLRTAKTIRFENIGRDKSSFRLLADVLVDEQDLKTVLLAEQFACAEKDIANLKRFKIKRLIKKGRGVICPKAPESKKKPKKSDQN